MSGLQVRFRVNWFSYVYQVRGERVNRQPGHLSDRQIQDCAITSPGGGPREIEAHLSQCESCLGRLLRWQLAWLKIPGATGMRPPYAECPAESTLQEVAARLAAPELSSDVLR